MGLSVLPDGPVLAVVDVVLLRARPTTAASDARTCVIRSLNDQRYTEGTMQSPSDLTRDDGAPNVATLPDRERDIAALVAEGLGDAEIAERLGLTPATVAPHLGHALRVLRLRTRLRLAVWATEQGLRDRAADTT